MSEELVWLYFAYKIGNACVGLAFLSFAAIIIYLIASIQLDRFSVTALVVLVSVFALSTVSANSLPSLAEIKTYIAYRTCRDAADQKEADRLIELITRYIED